MTAVPTSVLALLFAVACGSPRDLGAPSATASGSAAPESSSVVPSASASATKPADKSALLRSGRKLSQAGQWKEAAQALDRARALDPDDVIVLSELGWAELNAADLTASQATSEHALSVAKEPRLRAQVLYNLGRVAEANGDRDTAKKRYEESLALRASRAVQSRLESLGGKAPPAARCFALLHDRRQ